MRGGLPGNSFVLVEFEEGGGVSEIAALAVGAVGLDRAEGVEAFLELDEAMGVDDVGWWLVAGGWWASSWTSWDSVGVAGWYSSMKRRRWFS